MDGAFRWFSSTRDVRWCWMADCRRKTTWQSGDQAGSSRLVGCSVVHVVGASTCVVVVFCGTSPTGSGLFLEPWVARNRHFSWCTLSLSAFALTSFLQSLQIAVVFLPFMVTCRNLLLDLFTSWLNLDRIFSGWDLLEHNWVWIWVALYDARLSKLNLISIVLFCF